MSTIRWLGDDDCHHAALVGGKAASLSRLASKHTVPHGFAISAIAAAEHALVDSLLPAIGHAYRRLGERCGTVRPPVAVRSSALDEDGLDASFAGQHDTYLNIRGVDAVQNAIRRCIMSAGSHEALAYRRHRGLCADGVQMAVLVQQLVRSDVSAVVFSANPVSGSRDEMMINSNWGLGESIVGGAATPDTFVVQKRGLEISARDIARKDRMTVLTDTGTCERDVSPELRSVASLTDSQVREVAELALALERSTGQPVDVECAIARDTLYLLQCRPITTLG
jgi:pyruvate,water dikinase